MEDDLNKGYQSLPKPNYSRPPQLENDLNTTIFSMKDLDYFSHRLNSDSCLHCSKPVVSKYCLMSHVKFFILIRGYMVGQTL